MPLIATPALLRLRKRLPAGLRRWLRIARHLVTSGTPSPPLPANLVSGCRVCASRNDLVAELPRNGTVAEVGTLTGAFAAHILRVADPHILHLIDLDFGGLDPAVAADPRVLMHQAPSDVALAGLPDAAFDWIYIDADHSYAAVARDAAAAAAKVRPGGFLVFNDFAHIDPFLGVYGVHRAVVEFAIARQWPLAWLAYEPNALYDVALRRPG